jgi:hypothetical protein
MKHIDARKNITATTRQEPLGLSGIRSDAGGRYASRELLKRVI